MVLGSGGFGGCGLSCMLNSDTANAQAYIPFVIIHENYPIRRKLSIDGFLYSPTLLSGTHIVLFKY